MGLVDRLAGSLFRKSAPIATRADLAAFLESRSAFLSQKGIVEFCRVRAGVYWQKLFSEAEFKSELTRSTWRAYPPCYALLCEMVEASLRAPAGIRQRQLPDALCKLASETFAGFAVPRDETPEFWTLGVDLVRQQLAATQAGPPRPVYEMPDPIARAVFNVMPIHQDIISNDYDYIFNFLRMNLLRAHEEFIANAHMDTLVEDLLGAR